MPYLACLSPIRLCLYASLGWAIAAVRLKQLSFSIAVPTVSKGPTYQNFYWLFGWKLKKTLQKLEISETKLGKKNRDRMIPPILKKNDDEKQFFIGLKELCITSMARDVLSFKFQP